MSRPLYLVVRGVLLAGCCLVSGLVAAQPTATFQGLGVGFTGSALSRNGKVVVGWDSTDAAYWSNGTITHLGIGEGAEAFSCNADGSIIVGADQNNKPFVWTSRGEEELPLLSGDSTGAATLISADGSVIAGSSGMYTYLNGGMGAAPVIWTDLGLFALPNANDPIFDSPEPVQLNAISDDGSTLVAQAFTTPNGAEQFGSYSNYSENVSSLDGYVSLTNVVSYDIGYEGFGASISYLNSAMDFTNFFCLTSNGSSGFGGAYYLSAAATTQPGNLTSYIAESTGNASAQFHGSQSSTLDLTGTPVTTSSTNAPTTYAAQLEVHSCSSDGSILAGTCVWDENSEVFTNPGSNQSITYASFVSGPAGLTFGETNKYVDPVTFFGGKGATVTGWSLTSIRSQGVSSDGSAMIGWGTDPSGKPETWIATIAPAITGLSPSPATVVGGQAISLTATFDYEAGQAASLAINSSDTNAISNTSFSVA